MILHGKVEGVFEFFLPRAYEPDENILRVIEHVGTQMAHVLERAKGEEAIEKQREFLDAVLESLYDGVVACNAEGKLTLFNKATREFHGIDANSDVPPEQWAEHYDLYHADGKTHLHPTEVPLMRALRGEKLRDVEIVIAPTNGPALSVLTSGRAIFSASGKKLGAVATMFDVTQMKKKEAELIEANGALKRATEAKSEFLANMSHEIRTPLNGIIGMSEIMLSDLLDPKTRDQVDVIRLSGNNLLTVVSDILDFSKIEAGKLDLEDIPFDLGEVVRGVHRTLGLAAEEKKIALVERAPTGAFPQLIGDPGRVRQIILNLVNNALKFTVRGSIKTSIEASVAGDGRTRVRVEVSDTGIGIPEVARGRLFQAFAQADSSTTRKFGGMGLGLSISKRLVELMNGEIGFESEVGVGSKFWFTIELKNAAEQYLAPRAEPRATESNGTRTRCRVLLAEDNPVNQIIAVAMIKNLGHDIDVVENGIGVLNALAEQRYDLILMDCQMPEMDGYEASRRIRSAPSVYGNVWIIAMTANAMKGDREACLAAGMNDYVSKPVSLLELEAAIGRAPRMALSRKAA